MYSREMTIPEDVNVEIDKNKVKVSGAKGNLERGFKLAYDIRITKDNNKIKIVSEHEERKAKSLVGTILAHIRNMFIGVTKGHTYKMKIVFSHFPMTVKVDEGRVVIQNFLGERTPRIAKIIGNTQVKIEGQNVIVNGIDAEDTGQTASNIELACRIVGYDKRRFNDGIYIVSKE